MERKRQSFITSVNAQRPGSDELADVRLEHGKLLGVIDAFGVKVDQMVDKQRKEFMEAYDAHMQNIQRELILLRNKVVAIDRNFREEKLKRIQADEEKYRNESLRLDKVVQALAERLKVLTSEKKALVSEVDWLLGKFKKEKRKNSRLIKGIYYSSIEGAKYKWYYRILGANIESTKSYIGG